MNWRVIGRRLLIGSLPVLALLAVWPAAPAMADALGDLLNTVSQLGSTLSSTQGIDSQIQNIQQNVAFPLSSIQSYESVINTIRNTYRPWMTQVNSQPLSSAQLATSASLESQMRSSVATQPGSLTANYQATYGPPVSTGLPPTLQQASDMNDANALDAISLATATDQGSATLISLANQLEDQTATTAPGTADMIAAQAMALQLESLAAQHKLLASELRQEASLLGTQNATQKMHAVHTQTSTSAIQNFLNLQHPGGTH